MSEIFINTLGDKPDFIPYDHSGHVGVAKAAPKASGYIMIGSTVVAETQRCPNCSTTFVMVKNSGKFRPYCTDCRRHTCGISCFPCEHKMKRRADYGP